MEISTFPSKHKVVVGFSFAAFVLTVATLVMIPSAVKNIFSTGFLPHRYCYLYDRPLIALHRSTAGTTQACKGGRPASVVELRQSETIAGLICAGATTPSSGSAYTV
jgi:hypothetical protein